MPRLRLFGPARDAAGIAVTSSDGSDVAAVLDAAQARFGPEFAGVVATSAIWVNGIAARPDTPVGEDDEVAVLPPVSGG